MNPRLMRPYATATHPDAPTGLSATAGDEQVELSWTAPASDGGAAITDYVVEYSEDQSSWTVFADGTNTLTTATVTGLTNDTQYYFRIATTNNAGTGPYSNIASATPFLPCAGTQATLLLNLDSGFTDSSESPLTVTAEGDAAISTTEKKFGAGSVYFGTAAADYLEVSSVPALGSGDWTMECWLYLEALGAGGGSHILGRHEACAGAGPMLALNNSTGAMYWEGGTTLNGVDAVPLNEWVHLAAVRKGGSLTLYLNGDTQATGTVSGTLSEYSYPFRIGGTDGCGGSGSGIQGYVDDFRLTIGLAVYDGPFLTPAAALEPCSTAASVVTRAGAPTGISVTMSSGEAEISWTAPSSAGSAGPITDYRIQLSTDDGATVGGNQIDGSSPYVWTGLTDGTDYWFRVAARTAGGHILGTWSSWSGPHIYGTPPTPPDQITDLAAAPSNAPDNSVEDRIDLTWSLPGDNGVSITGQTLQYSEDETSWTTITGVGASDTSWSWADGSPATLYYFRVRATNADGDGNWSASASATFPLPGCTNPDGANYDADATYDDGSCVLPPDQITGLSVSPSNGPDNGDADRIDLSWNAPNANNSTITSQTLQRSVDGSTWTTITGLVGATDTSASWLDGTPGTAYSFRIRATNGEGDGPWSAVEGTTFPKPGCTDSGATNYDATATYDDGSCSY